MSRRQLTPAGLLFIHSTLCAAKGLKMMCDITGKQCGITQKVVALAEEGGGGGFVLIGVTVMTSVNMPFMAMIR